MSSASRALAAATLAVLVWAGAGASAPTTHGVAPGAVLDQQNPHRPKACVFGGWAPDDATSWAAQTFTAGMSGTLTDVVLRLRATVPEQMTVAITPVDANGQPIVSSPLTSTTANVPVTDAYEDAAVAFASPPKLVRGTPYAIVLSVPNANALGGSYIAWAGDIGSSQFDASGAHCADGAYAGGRVWTHGSDPLGADADFFFQTYVAPARKLTVRKVGSGSGSVSDSTNSVDCGRTCSADFSQGQSVTLSATPAPGSSFVGWQGGCSGPTACVLTMTADTDVTATFVKKLYSLAIRKVGSGTVLSRPAAIACGTRCRANMPIEIVILTARPAAGFVFARWQGACRGTRPTCRLELDHAQIVTAVFAKR